MEEAYKWSGFIPEFVQVRLLIRSHTTLFIS